MQFITKMELHSSLQVEPSIFPEAECALEANTQTLVSPQILNQMSIPRKQILNPSPKSPKGLWSLTLIIC